MTEQPPPAAAAGASTSTDTSRTSSPASPDDPVVDLVPGDPPVPITVWRTAEDDHDQHSLLPPRLARRLVAAYSLPGEGILDVTDRHALAAAALHAGRHHRPAWFTDASSPIIGPVTPANTADDTEANPNPTTADGNTEDEPTSRVGQRACSPGAEAGWPRQVGWWAGEADAIDEVPHAGVADAKAEDHTMRTSLVVARWPPTTAETDQQTRLRWLLRIASRLLQPGGCLVLVLAAGAGSARPAGPADLGPLVAAAANAGLGYLQHIVAVRADVDGDRFTYYASPDELATLARHPNTHAGGDEPAPVRHLRVHTDLLVFSRREHGDG